MRKTLGCAAVAVLALTGAVAHGAAPLDPGTISVETGAVEPAVKSAIPAFVEAVGAALAARDFTLLDDAGHSRFVADLRLTRVEAGTGKAKVPTDGPSASAGGSPRSVGGGVSFSLPTQKTKAAAIMQTRLEIHIRKQGEQPDLWHGAAMTVRSASAANGTDKALAKDLVEAIFHDYPIQSEGVASVP